MHTLVQICHLSLRDYLHERLLSACAVLGLAAVLAPLLILFGVKFGVVETLTERLRSDPAGKQAQTILTLLLVASKKFRPAPLPSTPSL